MKIPFRTDIGLSLMRVCFGLSIQKTKAMENNVMEPAVKNKSFMSAEQFLNHWQGHRRLTRRMIEVFPDDKLFTYSVGGMRPFGKLVMEMLGMAGPGARGVVSGVWESYDDVVKSLGNPATKQELLALWDRATDEINEAWSKVSEERLQKVDKAFGQYEGKGFSSVLYFVDNEIHHRAQAYVYLRTLGIEPPYFWER